jgi:hypothetical protein
VRLLPWAGGSLPRKGIDLDEVLSPALWMAESEPTIAASPHRDRTYAEHGLRDARLQRY